MDNTPQHFFANVASNMSDNPSRVVDTRVVYSPAAARRLDSPGSSSSSFSSSKGSKRKWSTNDGSLVFGLGCLSNSCGTMSSGNETHESTVHLGLSINLHFQDESMAKRMNVSCGTLKGKEVEKPKLDLELSLSTGAADSGSTSVTQGFSSFQNNVESADKFGAVHLVDEGSTSSRWKLGPLVQPLHASQTTERVIPSVHPQSHMNPNPVVPNLTPKSSVGGASGITCNQQQRRNASVKICQFNGCTRGARGASGLCIAHGGGRRCKRAGCQKGAEGKTVFCKAHGGGRRCQYLGCTRSAEGRTDYCIGHGGGRRCSHEECSRAARGKSGLCIKHGGGKRCKMENCSKSAEGISGLCISHGGGRRCQYPACTKGAQGSTTFCKAHGGGKRCTFFGCIKGAEGSTPFCKGHGGGKRCSFEGGCTKSVHGGTLFCVNHGGGKRCAAPECTKSARGRTNFCVRHGGGKRCKSEGCLKSAQGKTDFCKAHGGGKRCSWGQLGSEFGGQCGVPCDKFARGKSGLCAAHSALVQDPFCSTVEKIQADSRVNGIKTAGSVTTSIDFMGCGHHLIPVQVPSHENLSVGNALGHFSLPEGRVRGGNLMAMLRGNNNFGPGSLNLNDQLVDGPSEPGKPYHMPHSWV